MLSRTAENLFWLSRYVERAENMARLMEMGYRMALMPAAASGNRSEWESVLSASGCAAGYDPDAPLRQEEVANFLIFNRDNHSSIINCFEYARANARAMRTAITAEMWEALNNALMELRRPSMHNLAKNELPEFIDWVKKQGALFRGPPIPRFCAMTVMTSSVWAPLSNARTTLHDFWTSNITSFCRKPAWSAMVSITINGQRFCVRHRRSARSIGSIVMIIRHIASRIS